MAWLGFFFSLKFLNLVNFYRVWFLKPPFTLDEIEKNHLDCAGFKPGPFAWKVSALSITPRPLGRPSFGNSVEAF